MKNIACVRCFTLVFSLLSALAVIVGSTSAAAASLPRSGLCDGTGDSNYTCDPNTNLEFLDLTVTLGRTYTDISGKLDMGEEFEGHRYATESEIRQLFEHAGILYVGQSTLHTENWQPVNDLIDLVGETLLGFGYRIGAGFTAEPSGGWTRQIAVLQAQPVSSTAMAYFSNTSPGSIQYGHWLARNPPYPNPVIQLERMELVKVVDEYFGRFYISTKNWKSYPTELFNPAPNLPPCGANTKAARSWVDIFDGVTDKRLSGFCALGQPSNLQNLWFGVRWGDSIPESVYIEIYDREENRRYRSNRLQL